VRVVAALALALALAAAGCGGDSRLSRTELAKRAGRICTDQARTIAQIPRGPATAENAAGYLGAVLSVVERGLKQFHSLKPAASVEPTYRRFLTELDRNADILRTLRAAAAARTRRQYEAGLSDLHRSRVRIDAFERRLGFGGCAAAATPGA
jgi:hypothetical protein